MLHEAYCYRNIIACKMCPEYYDKRDPDSHLDIHKMVKIYCFKFCSAQTNLKMEKNSFIELWMNLY